MRNRLTLAVAALLMAAGIALTGHGLMVPLKAWLSVQLLDRAWARVLAGDDDVRPWPWMDSEPVARLIVPPAGGSGEEHEQSFIVMRGVSGAVLAFAPGWHEQTALPGGSGTTLISAHRDTHFALLQGIDQQDRFVIEDRRGRRSTYQVSEMVVTEQPSLRLFNRGGPSRLLLVTCYPLNEWQPNSRQRLVVVADAVPSDAQIPDPKRHER